VADLPQFLTLKNSRDRTERVELVIRRTTVAADLEVGAPAALRGGLYYQGRLTVEPKRDFDLEWQIPTLNLVQWAVFESGGRISFIPKS
jgi:hypothetical protein